MSITTKSTGVKLHLLRYAAEKITALGIRYNSGQVPSTLPPPPVPLSFTTSPTSGPTNAFTVSFSGSLSGGYVVTVKYNVGGNEYSVQSDVQGSSQTSAELAANLRTKASPQATFSGTGSQFIVTGGGTIVSFSVIKSKVV